MNGGGCCTRAHALPPEGAAAAATNSNLVMSGTTRKKRSPTLDETSDAKKQRHHYHLQEVIVLGKRKYEDSESDSEVGCRENDKMFKCNYWEDPAYAKRLQRDGLRRARIAALDNQMERLLMHREFDEAAPDAPQQPEPAGASDPPIISRPEEVPNCPDRYCRFYHDYC